MDILILFFSAVTGYFISKSYGCKGKGVKALAPVETYEGKWDRLIIFGTLAAMTGALLFVSIREHARGQPWPIITLPFLAGLMVFIRYLRR